MAVVRTQQLQQQAAACVLRGAAVWGSLPSRCRAVADARTSLSCPPSPPRPQFFTETFGLPLTMNPKWVGRKLGGCTGWRPAQPPGSTAAGVVPACGHHASASSLRFFLWPPPLSPLPRPRSFETLGCEMIFGQAPPPIEQDKL